MMYAANIRKVAILLGALVEAEAGRLPIKSLTTAVMINMIRFCRSEDATRVSHWIGIDRLLEILQSSRFALYDRAGGGGPGAGKGYGPEPAARCDPLNNLSRGTTAFQVARLYWMLDNDQLLSPPMNAPVKQVLSIPGIHHKFVKGLDARPGVDISRESGTWENLHADSARVESHGKRFVLVDIAELPDGSAWLARLAAPLDDLIVPAAPQAVAYFGNWRTGQVVYINQEGRPCAAPAN